MDVIRKFVVNFPLYKEDIILYVCNYLCDEKFLYHDSIENYVIKKGPTFKRKLFYHLVNSVFILLMLKYLLFIFYPNDSFKIQFGEIIFIWIASEYQIAYIFIVLVSLFLFIFKIMIYYYEIHYKLKVLNLLHNLCEKLPFYVLINNKEVKLTLLTNIFFWILRIISIQARIILSLTLLILILYIYLFLEYKFSIIILLFTVIHAYFFYKNMMVIITSCFILIFIMLIFLKWKLDELIKSIRISILWRNKIRLLDNMKTYNKFTKLVHEISDPINHSIGLFFLIFPSILSTALIVLKGDTNTLIGQLLHLLLLLYLPAPILFLGIFNYYCASIPLRNRSIAKYFYPIFYDKNFHRIQMHRSLRFYSYRTQTSNLFIHMKIDSFIARLNKQFVGFYCFNLFKFFTKLALLQFLSYLITVYILFNKLNK